MSSIHSEKQKLSPDALLSLFTLDATAIGGTVLRFVQAAHSTAPVSFGGAVYNPIDIKFDGLEVTGQGALPRPSVSLANSDGAIQAIINTWGELNGATFTRIRTFTRFLDGGSEPDGGAYFGPDVFSVEQKTSDTPAEITWELSAVIDQQGRMIPGRVVVRDTCLWRYRVWDPVSSTFDLTRVQCPYTGTKYWDANDNVVTNPAKDKPSRTVNCCRLRFGEGKNWPFGGFPGMPRAK